MAQIVELTQNGHYFAIKPEHSKAISPIWYQGNSIIDGASISLKGTIRDGNGNLDFINASNLAFITNEALNDYVAETKINIFDNPTFQGELGGNNDIWYVFYLLTAGVSTSVKFRLFNNSSNLIVSNV